MVSANRSKVQAVFDNPTPRARGDRAPRAFAPRGMRLPDAVFYTGFGQTKFLEMVADGRMPPGKMVDGCRVWDRLQLDDAWDLLVDGSGESPAASGTGWEDVQK